MVTGINTALSAQVLQLLGISGRGLKNSISALSSGNRLVRASTDVAALSAATSLQSQLTGLRRASLNVTQASSFLEVADGGLKQAQDITDRLAALSTQANSGALSASARQGLNTEFQNLVQEINRISGNTNFNGVKLLDGSLSRNSSLKTVETGGDTAKGQLVFTANPTAGQTVQLNNVTLVAGTDFAVGATVQATVSNLSSALNADSRFAGYKFSAQNGTLGIEARAAGSAGNQFVINQAGSTAAFFTSGDPLSGAGRFSLSGGTDAGLSAGDTSVSGTVGDSLVSATKGQAASTTARFNSAADIQAGNTLQIDNGEGGFTNFTFVNGTPANNTQIQIGSTLEETLQNAANTLNNFSGTGDFGIRQLNVTTDGRNLTFTGRAPGNVNDASGAALDIALGTAGGSLTSAQLNNGVQGGVDVSGVVNPSFIGSIQGFKATYTNSNQLNLSIDVGGVTYSAQVANTNPAANTSVRFTSQSGGSFDVTLQGGQGSTVTNQSEANGFANRLDAAFKGLNFNQSREVGFTGTGSLIGASLQITGDNASTNVRVQDVRVTDNSRGNSTLEIVINGDTYRATNLGNSLGAGDRIRLTSVTDGTRSLDFTNGSTRFDLSNSDSVKTLTQALERNLGIPGGQGASFQVGDLANDTVNLQIGDISSKTLFDGRDINILTASDAAQALNFVRNAQDYLSSQRANVGAYSQALNYTGAQLDSAIQNQDAARSILADTDFGSESTLFSQLLTQNQAQIAAQVQGNRLQGSILKLLG